MWFSRIFFALESNEFKVVFLKFEYSKSIFIIHANIIIHNSTFVLPLRTMTNEMFDSSHWLVAKGKLFPADPDVRAASLFKFSIIIIEHEILVRPTAISTYVSAVRKCIQMIYSQSAWDCLDKRWKSHLI